MMNAISGVISLIALGLVLEFFLHLWHKKRYDKKIIEERKKERCKKAERAALAPEREKAIRAFYQNKMNISSWTTGDKIFKDKLVYNQWIDVSLEINFSLSRSLSSMTQREADILLYTELLDAYGIITEGDNAKIHLAIIYNEGNCDKTVHKWSASQGFADKHSIKSEFDAIKYAINLWDCASSHAGISLFLTIFSFQEKMYPNSHIVREIKSKILGGSNWLSDSDVGGSVFNAAEKNGSVFIGETETGERFWLSLIHI